MPLTPSMEGGGIPPPDVVEAMAPAYERMVLQWRAGEFPRLTRVRAQPAMSAPVSLQWRAGEFPRLTRRTGRGESAHHAPFNGGRGNSPA